MYSVQETLQEQIIKIRVFVILLAHEKTPVGVSQSVIPVSVQILILISRSVIYMMCVGVNPRRATTPPSPQIYHTAHLYAAPVFLSAALNQCTGCSHVSSWLADVCQFSTVIMTNVCSCWRCNVPLRSGKVFVSRVTAQLFCAPQEFLFFKTNVRSRPPQS